MNPAALQPPITTTTTTMAPSPSPSQVVFPLAEFQAGVTACLRSWSAFRTAVEGGWGGNDSIRKADNLRQHIYDVFMPNPSTTTSSSTSPSMDAIDLEDNLVIYLEEEFSVTLEDGSEQQVTATLFQLYAECLEGKTTLAEQLVGTALRYEQQIAAAYPVHIQSTEHDDDDDGDDNAMMDTTATSSFSLNVVAASQAPPDQQQQQQQHQPATTVLPAVPFTTAVEYASQSLFGKPKPPRKKERTEPEEVPMMDEDGFATVTKNRRKPRS